MASGVPPGNAIEQRLDLIEEQWFAFTDDARARLGRWRLDGDGIQLVEVFLESQTVAGTAVPDFFVRLWVPFRDPLTHGLTLRASFVEEIDAGADDMRAVGVDPVWPVPGADPTLDDIGQLLTCLHAFREHYRDLVQRVVIVLMVDEIADAGAWVWWLDRLIQRLPEQLRFMVFDPAPAPRLDDLALRYPVQLKTLAPELDVPGAIDSLVRQVGGNGPADVFRRMFVGMGTAAQRGNVAGALTLAASAIAVAQKQDWLQQVAAVHMASGALLLGAGRITEALNAFRASGATATASMKRGDPGSDRVAVHAKLAEGSALLQAEDYAQAARAYEEALTTGEGQGTPDPLLMIESRRMAAYCYERTRRPDLAWTHLGAALQLGDRIDPAQRAHTTLPFVAQALLRLAADPTLDRQRALIETRVAELLGANWQGALMELA